MHLVATTSTTVYLNYNFVLWKNFVDVETAMSFNGNVSFELKIIARLVNKLFCTFRKVVVNCWFDRTKLWDIIATISVIRTNSMETSFKNRYLEHVTFTSRKKVILRKHFREQGMWGLNLYFKFLKNKNILTEVSGCFYSK